MNHELFFKGTIKIADDIQKYLRFPCRRQRINESKKKLNRDWICGLLLSEFCMHRLYVPCNIEQRQCLILRLSLRNKVYGVLRDEA